MKVQGSFTLRGALLLIGVVLCALTGFIFGDSALLILSLLLVILMVVAALLAWWNLRGLEVSVETPCRVEAGRKFDLSAILRNGRGFMDSVAVDVRFQISRELRVEARAGWIATQSESLLKIPVVSPQRDCVMELHHEIVSSFPLGLFTMSRRQSEVMSPPLLVLPKRIVPRELLVHGALATSSLENGVSQYGDQGDLKGIRPWQTGDVAKHIHWSASARSLARGHELRVREYEPPAVYPEHCALIFHSYGSGGALLREDRFERVLAFMAGTLQHLYGLGVKSTVHADFLGWRAMECKERADLVELYAILAQAQRSVSTEAHTLQNVLNEVADAGAVVVLSEVEIELWSESVDAPKHAVLVDIKQVNFKRRKTNHGKEVARA